MADFGTGQYNVLRGGGPRVTFDEYFQIVDEVGDVAEFAVRNGRLFVRTAQDGDGDRAVRLDSSSWVTVKPETLEALLRFLATKLQKP